MNVTFHWIGSLIKVKLVSARPLHFSLPHMLEVSLGSTFTQKKVNQVSPAIWRNVKEFAKVKTTLVINK